MTTWVLLTQEVGELTVRLSVTRTALPSATATAGDVPGGRGPHATDGLPYGATKASTPTCAGSQVHEHRNADCIRLDHDGSYRSPVIVSSVPLLHHGRQEFLECATPSALHESMMG